MDTTGPGQGLGRRPTVEPPGLSGRSGEDALAGGEDVPWVVAVLGSGERRPGGAVVVRQSAGDMGTAPIGWRLPLASRASS